MSTIRPSEDDLRVRLLALWQTLEQYRHEEHAQGQGEQDERRRAWHDGRASAYQDVVEQLESLLHVT